MPVVPRRGPGYVPTTPNQPLSPAGAFQPPRPVDIGQAADQISKIVEEHQRQVDQTALLEADNKLSDLRTNLEVQAIQTRGKDALAAGPAAETAWQKGSSDIANTLTNDRQKEAFQARADHHWQVLNETVQKHGAQEFQQYDAQNTEAALQNRRNDAVTHNSDPALIGQSLAESHDLITLYGQRNGWSSEKMKEKQASVSSAIHAGVIQSLSDSGQDLAAKDYFTAHKSDLVENDLLKVERTVKESSVKGESQRQRDLILQKATSNTDAIAMARQIADPDVQEATERLVRQDLSERAAAQRDQREQTMTELGNTIDQGGIGAIPPSKWSTLNPSEKTSLLEYAKKKQDPGGVTTDLPTFYNLETMATTPETRDKFLQLDLNTLRSKLSPSDFEEMAKLQGSVRKGEAAAEAKLGWIDTKRQIVSQVMNGALIGISKKAKVTDNQARSQFRGIVDAEVERIQTSTGKPATPAQVKEIANEFATRYVVEKPWYESNDKVPLFQIGKREDIILGIKDVPVAQRAQIQDALRQRNRPITDAAVIDWYRRYLQSRIPEPE